MESYILLRATIQKQIGYMQRTLMQDFYLINSYRNTFEMFRKEFLGWIFSSREILGKFSFSLIIHPEEFLSGKVEIVIMHK